MRASAPRTYEYAETATGPLAGLTSRARLNRTNIGCFMCHASAERVCFYTFSVSNKCLFFLCVGGVYERVEFLSRFLHDQRARLHRRFDELIVSGTPRAYVCRRWREHARSRTHHEVGIRINHRRIARPAVCSGKYAPAPAPHRTAPRTITLLQLACYFHTIINARQQLPRCARTALQKTCSKINFTKVLISIRNPIWFSNYGKPIGNVFITNTYV